MSGQLRFGVQAVPQPGWLETVRRLERLGFDVILTPDRPHLASSGPVLAAAAAVAERVHVGNYVLAATLHEPAQLVRECSTLSRLYGDRYEPGIGSGLGPAADPNPARRLEAAAHAIREALPAAHLLVAAAGRRALKVAAEVADAVALALPPQAGAEAVLERRELLGAAADHLELNLSLTAVGELGLSYAQGWTPAQLREAGAVTALWGDEDNMAELLLERRARLGVTYWTLAEQFAPALAPVVERLHRIGSPS